MFDLSLLDLRIKNNFRLNLYENFNTLLQFFFLVVFCFGQVKDPETGELVNLKYDKKSGSYYLFGLDKMELLDKNVFQGKFMGASDSLVFFKTELDGGKILEQEIASIKNLVLESNVIDNNILVYNNPKTETNCKGIKNKTNSFIY